MSEQEPHPTRNDCSCYTSLSSISSVIGNVSDLVWYYKLDNCQIVDDRYSLEFRLKLNFALCFQEKSSRYNLKAKSSLLNKIHDFMLKTNHFCNLQLILGYACEATFWSKLNLKFLLSENLLQRYVFFAFCPMFLIEAPSNLKITLLCIISRLRF